MILGDPSRSYAVSAPADRDASPLCYSYRIIKGGGGGGVGGEILVVVTQCLLLPTGTHHSYTTHTVSLRGGRRGGDHSRGYAVSAPADRDASRLYYSYRIIKGGGGGDPSRSYAVSAPADRDASQLDYSYRIIKGGGGGVT